MVLEKDSELAPHSEKRAPFYSECIGLVDIKIVFFPAAKMHSEKGLCVEPSASISNPKNANFGPCFEIEGVFRKLLVSRVDISDASIDAHSVTHLIGSEQIDPFIAKISSIVIGVADEKFISEVAREMPPPGSERPSVESIGRHCGHEKIGIDHACLDMVEIKDRENTCLDSQIHITPPPEDIFESYDDEVPSEGDCADMFSNHIIVEPKSGRVDHLSGVGDQGLKQNSILRKPDDLIAAGRC